MKPRGMRLSSEVMDRTLVVQRSCSVVVFLAAAVGTAYWWWNVSDEGHLYWAPGMPGIGSAVLAALFLAGVLLLCKRFSLRGLLIAVVLTALDGPVGHMR